MDPHGIRVLQAFENEGSATSRVAIKMSVDYKTLDREWLWDLWEKHKSAFAADQYDDPVWKCESEFGDRHLWLRWDTLSDRLWQDQVKSFTLLLIDRNISSFALAARIQGIINFISITDYFSKAAFPLFQDDPYSFCKSDECRHDLLAFLDYIPLSVPQYANQLRELRYPQEARDIPAFESIRKFDQLISNYKTHISCTNPYIIIVLWWELTKVIPIRPIEFFTLRKGSFITDEGGKHYVCLDRAKVRSNTDHEVPILDKIGISDDIYNLFDQYRSFYKEFLVDDKDFLFNIYIFRTFGLANYISRDGYIGAEHMYLLFNSFFYDIVHKMYGYSIVDKGNDAVLGKDEIERFQYGDSRHIAFLNLLLSGFSPYTIAQIGGHTTLRQQLHYYTHLEKFLESKAYGMAEEARSPFHKYSKEFDIREKYAMSKALDISSQDLKSARKINIGWCMSECFPYDCVFDDCLDCRHSIIDRDHIDLIPEKIRSYETDIYDHVELIRRIISNPALGSDADRMTAINKINSDVASIASLKAKTMIDK